MSDAEIARLKGALQAAAETAVAKDQECRRLTAEIERLRAALRDARECVETWAGYASEYFRDKHDLAGDLARIDAALAAQPAPGGKDE